jgi:hypothetical protein
MSDNQEQHEQTLDIYSPNQYTVPLSRFLELSNPWRVPMFSMGGLKNGNIGGF